VLLLASPESSLFNQIRSDFWPIGRAGEMSSPFPRSRGARFAIIGGSTLLLCALLFFMLPANLAFHSDQNIYLGGVSGLVAGHGYRLEPYINTPPIGIYPPGYSVWLSIFWKSGRPLSLNCHRLEVANWLTASGALLALAGCLAIGEMPVVIASALVIALGTSVIFTQLMTGLFSDLLFAAGSGLLALFMATYEPDREVTLWWLTAGLLIGILYLVKTMALAYMAGLIAFGFYSYGLRRLRWLVCFMIPVLPALSVWFFLARNSPTYGSYVRLRWSELGGLGAYFWWVCKQGLSYVSARWMVEAMLSIPDRAGLSPSFKAFSGLANAFAFMLGLTFFSAPVLVGFLRCPKQPRELMKLFVVIASVLQFMLWPYYLGARCAMAIIPFVVGWVSSGYRSRIAKGAFAALLVANIPANIWLSCRIIRSEQRQSLESLEALEQAASWINESTGNQATVAAGRDVPAVQLWEFLGRRLLANASPTSGRDNIDVTPAEQHNRSADYVILDSSLQPAGWVRNYRVQRVFGKWTVASPSH
jgi:hypothetical protein